MYETNCVCHYNYVRYVIVVTTVLPNIQFVSRTLLVELCIQLCYSLLQDVNQLCILSGFIILFLLLLYINCIFCKSFIILFMLLLYINCIFVKRLPGDKSLR